MCNGDFDRAEKYLANGYSLIKKRGLYVDDAQAMANTLSLLATVCERQGKRMEAISYLDELQSLMKAANEDWGRAYYFQTVGFMASRKGETQKSSGGLPRSREILENNRAPR